MTELTALPTTVPATDTAARNGGVVTTTGIAPGPGATGTLSFAAGVTL